MKAAVVTSYDKAPRFSDFPPPTVSSKTVPIRVLASAISQLARLQASGKHYVKPTPPFVPGVDGVGHLEDGRLAYFAFPEYPHGAMAEWTAVPIDRVVLLPEDMEPARAAAMANPLMSSLAALRFKANFKIGQSVLINGATGASGRLAIQVCRYLGANRVIATGRSEAHREEILSLGADDYLLTEDDQFSEQLKAHFDQGIDVVLDYLWGEPAASVISAAGGTSKKASYPVTRFINIGSLAGPNIPLAAASIRSTGLEICGSGLGSIAMADLMSAIHEGLAAADDQQFTISYQTQPVAEIASHWNSSSNERTVMVFPA